MDVRKYIPSNIHNSKDAMACNSLPAVSIPWNLLLLPMKEQPKGKRVGCGHRRGERRLQNDYPRWGQQTGSLLAAAFPLSNLIDTVVSISASQSEHINSSRHGCPARFAAEACCIVVQLPRVGKQYALPIRTLVRIA